MTHMRQFVLYLALCVVLASCAKPFIRTDLHGLRDNREKYAQSRVVLTTDIKSLLDDPRPYRNHKVEVRGFVDYQLLPSSNDWSFNLYDEFGNRISCYEQAYRLTPARSTVMILRQAKHDQQPITVVGDLTQATRIETDWIEFQGRVIDTDFVFRPVLGTIPTGIRPR